MTRLIFFGYLFFMRRPCGRNDLQKGSPHLEPHRAELTQWAQDSSFTFHHVKTIYGIPLLLAEDLPENFKLRQAKYLNRDEIKFPYNEVDPKNETVV